MYVNKLTGTYAYSTCWFLLGGKVGGVELSTHVAAVIHPVNHVWILLEVNACSVRVIQVV